MPSPRVGKSFYGEGSPASETLATHARGIREEGDSVISTVMGQIWEEDDGLCSDKDDGGGFDGGESSSDDDAPCTSPTSHGPSLDAKCTSICSM